MPATYSWTITTPAGFSIAPSVGYIDVIFLVAMSPLSLQAADPQFWIITPVTSGAINISSTSVSLINPTTARLYHTSGKNGDVYNLTLPSTGLRDSYGADYDGISTANFTEQSSIPYIVSIYPVDTEIVRVTYSKDMSPWGCLTPENYSISPTLAVLSVTQVNSKIFDLHTDPQTTGVPYVVTISNVTDLLGNPL